MKIRDDADVDSNCFAPDPDTDRPEDRCHADATTYVTLPSGVRRYVCPDHAEDVDRFAVTTEDHPSVGVCERCERLTPVEFIDADAVCDDCRV